MFLGNKFKTFLVYASCFVSFITPFITCSFSQDAVYESLSSLIADIGVSDSKTKSSNINIFLKDNNPGIAQAATLVNECRSYSLNKTAQELYSFRATYNCGDDVLITLDEYDEHVTILPHTTSGIHKNSKNENVFDWFEIKVKNDHNATIDYTQSNSFVLIRESFAKRILEKDGIEYSLSNAQYLLESPHYITGKYLLGGEEIPVKYQIANIIIENEGNDSFLNNTFGEYITMYFIQNSLPNFQGISVNMDFGSSISENKRYLKSLKTKYPFTEYEYQISRKNLKIFDEVIETQIKDFENRYKNIDSNKHLNNVLAIVLSCFFQIGFLLPLIIKVYKNKKVSILNLLAPLISFVVVYHAVLIGSKFAYKFFFTTSASAISFIFCCSSFLLMIFLKKKYLHYILNSEKDYMEIEI